MYEKSARYEAEDAPGDNQEVPGSGLDPPEVSIAEIHGSFLKAHDISNRRGMDQFRFRIIDPSTCCKNGLRTRPATGLGTRTLARAERQAWRKPTAWYGSAGPPPGLKTGA
ncbi:MAG: hypothetical protein Q6373_000040 [Candidatus Sigynarchaeota archaeon]